MTMGQHSVYTVCDFIMLTFRSIFIERFVRSVHRSTVPVLRTASEWLQNVMISWAMEQSDTGETTLAFVELLNEHSQTRVIIEFVC